MKSEYLKFYQSTEKRHFWMKGRRRFIVQLCENILKTSTVLEVGCSTGLLLLDLQNMGFLKENLFGIDIDPIAIEKCKARGLENAEVMDAQNLTFNQKFDLIIASDTLEHLEDDISALNNWNQHLKVGGKLFVFVPAYQFLWSYHDEVNMHFRRYTRKELALKLAKSHFQIQKSSYWNFFSFFPNVVLSTYWENFASKRQEPFKLFYPSTPHC